MHRILHRVKSDRMKNILDKAMKSIIRCKFDPVFTLVQCKEPFKHLECRWIKKETVGTENVISPRAIVLLAKLFIIAKLNQEVKIRER